MEERVILNLISQAYQQNKMFESILFEGTSQEELKTLVNQVSRFLYCENHQFLDDQCRACQQFNLHQILDYQEIGNGLLAINKEVL